MKDFVKNREPFCSLQGSEVTVISGGGFPPMLLCQNLDVHYLKEQNLILGSWDKMFLLLSWQGELMAKKKKHFLIFQETLIPVRGLTDH